MIKKYKNWFLIFTVLIILLLFSILLALSIGEINFSLFELLSIIQNPTGIKSSILFEIRIPRIILGFAVGGALSISGLILQGIYRNPLVEPYTLGISGGSALGVSFAIVFGIQHVFSGLTLPIFGIIGALSTVFVLYIISLRKSYLNINVILLTGVMISFITSSAIMFLMATTTSENLQSIVFWTMGSLEEPNKLLIYLVLCFSILGLIIFYLFRNQLNALRLGESNARHLGINTDISIKLLFLIASILTGISVAAVGIIGFVGLIIPHLLRFFIGTDYRILIISSFLGGSIFLILADLLARTVIAPNELPIGVITGLIGGVVFIIALSRGKKNIE